MSRRAGEVDVHRDSRAQVHGAITILCSDTERTELIETLIAEHGGRVVRPPGGIQSCFGAFARAMDAVDAACAIQLALLEERWQRPAPLRVRIALHTGEAELRLGRDYQPTLNRSRQLHALAHQAQILVSAATAELICGSLPEHISLRDLGRHQPASVEFAEQIWQIVHPRLPSEFPPLGTSRPTPGNLPIQITSFIGRQQEIESIKTRLASKQVRLLTLTGVGGVGKTRLALQVAAGLQDTFADGVFFVSLAPISDPSLVGTSVAKAVGIRESGGRSIKECLIEHLRAKEVLVVLDNFEHLLAQADLLPDLLSACPRLAFLVTSRSALRLAAEQISDTLPLVLPDPLALLDLRVTGENDAVLLFCERAHAVRADFALTVANAPVVVRICDHLDGLPLSIELAAARIRLFEPPALLAQLSSRLRLLTGGPQDSPVRHRDLRSAIAWSYDLLTPAEQKLFARAALFVGGFTLDAAEAVANPDGELGIDTLDGIAALLDNSLLRRQQGDPEEARFGMLETVREYALERLQASNDEPRSRELHADFFRELASAATPELRGPRQTLFLATLEREHNNLRAALQWVLEQRDSERATGLGGALWLFWAMHAHLTEGRTRLDTVLELALGGLAEELRTAAHARVLNGAGVLAQIQSDYPAARSYLEASLKIDRVLGNRRGIGGALLNLGTVAWLQGEYAEARSLLNESLHINRALGDRVGIAFALSRLGEVTRLEGDYTTARSLQEESLAIGRQLGDKRGIGISLVRLGDVHRLQGDYSTARTLLDESLAIRRELGDGFTIASTLHTLGDVARLQADYALARSFYEESLTIRRQVGERAGVASSLGGLGDVALRQCNYALAYALFRESLALRRDVGDPVGIATSLEGLAAVAAAQEQPQRGLRLAGAAGCLRARIGAPQPAADREQLMSSLQAAWKALGEGEGAAAWSEGQAMDAKQAVAHALETDLRVSAVASTRTARAGKYAKRSLTSREREVARLIASGWSNREIAQALVIAVTTAERHVANILSKLALRSRTDVALWAVQNGLNPLTTDT